MWDLFSWITPSTEVVFGEIQVRLGARIGRGATVEKRHFFIGAGIALFVLGYFWGGTSYTTYSDDFGRTVSENIVWFGAWILGAILLLIGARLGDGK